MPTKNNTANPISKVIQWCIGRSLNPFSPNTFKHIALISFIAWIGLGADGLSSSCYGPEESFLALNGHTHLAIFIALATALTVFIISLAYNQVVELFPTGGGGYKVATVLLGKQAGLISGAALLIDYTLTIAISIASGIDALFSFLPTWLIPLKEPTEIFCIILLTLINLRGMKESILLLTPIFLGFVISHFSIIIYGILAHHNSLPDVIQQTTSQTFSLSKLIGPAAVAALLLHSYSLGSGTYTGLESVSNNVNRLAEPRIRTAKLTMLYMAISLSLMASGIILLYLLWGAKPVVGQTLNAVVFNNILGTSSTGHILLIITLSLEAGILFVAANTGFLAGPVVLANMAIDRWVPSRFRHLSNRLVTQNGIILFGLAAIAIIYWTHGKVSILVVLYSINVFITFSLSILGLCVYWIKHRARSKNWFWRFSFSLLGFIITSGILIATAILKFEEGGWITLVFTGFVIVLCLLIKRHYTNTEKKLIAISDQLAPPIDSKPKSIPQIKPNQPTAAFFISQNISVGMHTLLWALRLFPNQFKNFLFISGGIVDAESFRGEEVLDEMKIKVESTLKYFVDYCHNNGLSAKSYAVYGTDIVNQLVDEADKINLEFPDTIFFATKLVFENENWIIRMLHNETPIALQRGLHAQGKQLVILPMKI
ncbi:MAG: amino acid permease [Gammaproteobacteria bacterium]